MKFDSIILDIDGTIWNTTQIVAESWNKAIKNNFPSIPLVNAKILQTQFGKPMSEIADNLFPELNQSQKDFLMEECCKIEQEDLSKNTKNLAYKDVSKTIEKLSKKIPVFIVSNCQKGYIEVVEEKNHLENFIKDSECFGNNGNSKAENIALIIKRNNLKNTVYVGDTQGDADACKEANIPFIWASYGFGNPKSYDYKIETFSDLVTFF